MNYKTLKDTPLKELTITDLVDNMLDNAIDLFGIVKENSPVRSNLSN